jgi:hypothetical protein
MLVEVDPFRRKLFEAARLQSSRSISTPNALIKGKEMCSCSQLKGCSKPLVHKLSAGSGLAVCFDTAVVPHDF